MSGFWLGLAALGIGVGGWALWMRRINALDVPLRPWTQWIGMGLGCLLAIAAFANGPGGFGGLAAGLGLAMCAAFIILTNLSTPAGSAAFSVGEAAPDFTTLDSTGTEFELASLRGSPVLLKFFRGHW